MGFTPQRLPTESKEDYIKRRAFNNLFTKYRQKGNVFWNSNLVGTYRKKDMELAKEAE